MSVDFTVAIPTYNGEKRLPEVLDRLRECYAYTCRSPRTKNLSWEIIVVDNNSTDNTKKIIQSYQADWPENCSLKYCLEIQQGAAFARKLALMEAKSPLVGFLDDDNIPEIDWVEAAYTFGQMNSNVGAYASQIKGDFEVTPPENFEQLISFLAITDRGSSPLKYEPIKKVLPPSAGLVVRKQAWLESVPKEMFLTGRTKDSMLTGEDLEMLSYIQRAGWEIWYNPAMQITHKIPQWRFERDYLIPFFRGIGLSRYVTRMLSVKSWQRPLVAIAYMINDLRKIVFHLLKHGLRVKNDLVADCQMQLFWSSLISPFYWWKNGYLIIKDKS